MAPSRDGISCTLAWSSRSQGRAAPAHLQPLPQRPLQLAECLPPLLPASSALARRPQAPGQGRGPPHPFLDCTAVRRADTALEPGKLDCGNRARDPFGLLNVLPVPAQQLQRHVLCQGLLLGRGVGSGIAFVPGRRVAREAGLLR